MKIKLLLLAITCCIMTQVNAQDQMFDICPLKVGQQVPDAQMMNTESQPVNLLDVVASNPTVMIFYRGAWCGYCTKHLAELQGIKEEMEALGYQVIGVTIDQSEKLGAFAEKAESDIVVYSDAKLEVVKAFGLNWDVGDAMYEKYKSSYNLDLREWSGEDHHELPVPSIYVIKDQVVEFQYVNPNYKMRLKPETLMGVLKTL